MPRSRRAPRGQRLPIRSRPVSGGGSESGVALIVVLWLIVLLTLLASAAATLSVTHRRSLERYGETVRERALEDSAIRLTVLRLLAAKEPERARLLSRPQKVTVLDSVVAVTVTREAGRVDLNTSDSLMLPGSFLSQRFAKQQCRTPPPTDRELAGHRPERSALLPPPDAF